jgi:DeoR/GlpR family transcriptional regulator of sugar metabolism
MRFPQDPPDAKDATLPASRRNELLRLVKAHGQVTVQDLSARFQVSGDTIRRDLDFLAERGLLSRTHGGAVATQPKVGDDTPFAQRLNARKEAKARIGARAARLIADEETLLINGGSTVLAFAAALGGRRGLTVVTNNLSLPTVLPPQAVDAVYMLGGEVRQSLQVTLGPVGFAGAGGISADTAVLGVGGLSPAGLSTTRLNEATMLAAMVAAARRTIVLADSAKLGKDSFVRIAPLDRVRTLVTDAEPEGELAQALADAGVEVVLAEG